MKSTSIRRGAIAPIALVVTAGLVLMPVAGAWGATTIDGRIDLGVAESFGVLGATGVSNTGSSVIEGDVGLSPDTALIGFPPGVLAGTGVFHPDDGVAAQAQIDLDVAMLTAASLTPMVSGLANLTGMTLVAGVYAGGALSIDGNGALTLDGDSTDVWVFTAASTLITGSASEIRFTGGAGPCNVFWRVGSSATLGTNSDFAGTIMAEESITATTGTDVVGRLLAATAAVTLDTTDVVVPTGCSALPGTVSSTDGSEITSGEPPDATEGTPYSYTVTATGSPEPTYTVTSGDLPSGLELDSITGEISGTPDEPGSATFTITASNGTFPDSSMIVTIVTAAADGDVAAGGASAAALLPPTGPDPQPVLLAGILLALVGIAAITVRPARLAMSRLAR